MDPLSIGASAASIALASGKVATALYTFIGDAKNADANVRSLRTEVLDLERTATAIEKTWKENTRVAEACARDDKSLWSCVRASLEDSRGTIAVLDSTIISIEQRGFWEKGIFKKPSRAARLNMNAKDINQYRRQIHSHNSAMHSSLLTLNICLQLDRDDAYQLIARNLKALEERLIDTKRATQRGGTFDPARAPIEKDKLTAQNLQRLVQAAESFCSSTASTVIRKERSTVWEGSIADPLSKERETEINSWVPVLGTWDEDGPQEENIRSSSQNAAMARLPSALISTLIKEFLQEALTSFNNRDYAAAEESLRQTLNYGNQNNKVLKDRSAIIVMQAYVCAMQSKWDLVEEILVPGIGINAQDEIMKLDLLALFNRHKCDYDAAVSKCIEAIEAKTSRFGEASLQVFYSMSLVADICETQGKSLEAKIWLRSIQMDSTQPGEASKLHEDILSPAVDSIVQLTERLANYFVTKSVTTVPVSREPMHPQVEESSKPVAPSAIAREDKALVRVARKPPIRAPSYSNSWLKSLRKYSPVAPTDTPKQKDGIHKLAPSTYGNSPDESSVMVHSRTASDAPEPSKSPKALGSLRRVLEGQGGTVKVVDFAPDGRFVASLTTDTDSVRLWNASTGEVELILCDQKGEVLSMAISPDSRLVATGPCKDGSAVKLWDTATGKVAHNLKGHTRGAIKVAFSPDSRLVASASMHDDAIRLWDVTTGNMTHTLEDTGMTLYVAFSPDSRLLVSCSLRKPARVWNTATGKVVYTLEGHTERVYRVVFSPDGRLMASVCSRSKTVGLWHAATGMLAHILNGHTSTAAGVLVTTATELIAFSPDGRFLASWGGDSIARLWNVETGVVACCLGGHSGTVNSVAFAPNGRLVASVGQYDKIIGLWDVGTGSLVQILKGHTGLISSLAFSPDSRVLASGGRGDDQTIRLWDIS